MLNWKSALAGLIGLATLAAAPATVHAQYYVRPRVVYVRPPPRVVYVPRPTVYVRPPPRVVYVRPPPRVIYVH